MWNSYTVNSMSLRRQRQRTSTMASISPSTLILLCSFIYIRIHDNYNQITVTAFTLKNCRTSSNHKHSRYYRHEKERFYLLPLYVKGIDDENDRDKGTDSTKSSLDQQRPKRTQPYRTLGPILTKQLDDSLFRSIVQWLAELSLQDYQWRTNLFQKNEADRMIEESMARIRFGDENEEMTSYIRPMDAPTPGPLGQLERNTVSWLYDVFREEGRRAKRIIASSGKLIRPSDNDDSIDLPTYTSSISNTATEKTLGPLGQFEKSVVEFWTSIRKEEIERIRTKTWRPKDLPQRGPIGQLEYVVSAIVDEIRKSEVIRAQQSKVRGGAIVRPIDIPGPLGELELQISDVIQAELRRVREKRKGTVISSRNNSEGNIVTSQIIPPISVLRPKDATYQGPLGIAEANAYATIQSVSNEEIERLKAIQRTMIENRPMETNQQSVLGTIETFVVGILHAPKLLISVIQRVQELLSSSQLDELDIKILQSSNESTKTKSNQSLPSQSNDESI
jgi:hypothetical protein